VLATAPGVVVNVGWNGNYGRLIEVDHGMGIRTRYGHLRRILVQAGQRVELRQKIGEMGSSGRSTGIHLHYEILVNGEPRDPMKFLQAGEYVFKGL
jgi:murein DD-endopeptidase MepM/ murein hydrolase activator NlpD